MSKKRVDPHVSALVPVDPRKVTPRSVAYVLSILVAKRERLLAGIDASEKGSRGGGGPRGFQPEGATQAQTSVRGLAWLQGRVDKDFLLPILHWWYQDLVRLDVAGLPPWTGEPQDETTALYLLNEMILACQRALQPPTDATARTTEPWEGDDWDDLMAQTRRLLSYMGGRAAAQIADLTEAVWGEDPTQINEPAIHTAISRANHFLNKRGAKRLLSKVRGEPVIRWV